MTDPIAYQCNGCQKWSQYKKEYHDKLPRGWKETDEGYFCPECNKRKTK